jgi:outer membrane protein assembly factor BamA
MNKNLIFITIFIILIFSSCNITKNLKPNEYMLITNTVTIQDAKPNEFYDLIDYVRPIPNKPTLGFFMLKPALYANFQPDSTSNEVKDTQFRKWLREKGEKQILYDSNTTQYSVKQLQSVLKKMGYFNAVITPKITYLKKQKVNVDYVVLVKKPYFIRSVSYSIDITEYKRIILQDTINSIVKAGMQYNEDLIVKERDRIISNIKNQGYYYVTPNIITIDVDTINGLQFRDHEGNPTLSIKISVNFSRISDPAIKNKHQFKYIFDKVYVYTNYDPKYEKGLVEMDTTVITAQNEYADPTTYYFITPIMIKKNNNEIVHISDFRYKTIIQSIFTKKGLPFSQDAYTKSYKRFRDLNNFSIININFIEDQSQTDTIFKKGSINAVYKLTRTKPWGIKPQFELRTDLTSFSGTYFNRNIFKGAEYLNVNVFGNILYYNWWNKILGKEVSENKLYGEYGGNVSLDLPRYLFFKNSQNISSVYYRSSIRIGGSYSQLFSRLMLYANLSYFWSPDQTISHSLSPIDISTIDSRGSRDNNLISSYPDSYQRKFDKFILFSLKYGFDYHPKTTSKNEFSIISIIESVGSALTGINYLVDNTEKWNMFGSFNYCAFERGEFSIKYFRTISLKQSIATRFNFGIAIPITQTDVIPFEKSFYLGGANSMRGWTFRQLGPGSYINTDYIERTGDIKLEFNLEYRGTIYKYIKYGLFVDMGNVWLYNEYENMPNANFEWDRFYKEIAMNIGLGLRFDFSIFLLRLDYGLPIYNPNDINGQRWINKSWISSNTWKWAQGIQFSIGHAFNNKK